MSDNSQKNPRENSGEENPGRTERESYTIPPVNYQYKARLFEMIFSEKRELLELYNAVNESSYADPDLLEVNTLKNAVYMAMKNDISFLFDTTSLNLYEHQSTWNPNMPLRDLEYISALYSEMTKDENLFGRRLIKIPAPRFYVFYNGIDEVPDRMILKLSNAFMTQEPHPSLELETVLLNVNRGHNQKLMSACRTLRDYAEYTARVREYAAQLSTREAVEKAVTECIRENILSSFLGRYRAEVIAVSIFEYDQEAHMRMEREENYADGYAKGEEDGLQKGREEGLKKGREEGRAEGHTEGRAEGRNEMAVDTAKMMISKNEPDEKIVMYSGLSLPEIQKLRNLLHE